MLDIIFAVYVALTSADSTIENEQALSAFDSVVVDGKRGKVRVDGKRGKVRVDGKRGKVRV